MKIEIAREEDRLTVAAILVKNGYTVKQAKEKAAVNQSRYVYFVEAEKEKK